MIISTAWAFLAMILLITSWRLARAGKTTAHRNIMILLTIGAWVFIINYIFMQRYSEGHGSIPREYIPWIAFHGTLGLIPLIGATCLVASRMMTGGHRLAGHFNRQHKLYGRIFIAIWCFTHLGGMFNAFFVR